MEKGAGLVRTIPQTIHFGGLERSHRHKLQDPPGGYANLPAGRGLASHGKSGSQQSRSAKNAALKNKKAWDLAMSPAKNIPMNGIMLWMTGNGIQIFSIMITAMLLWKPLSTISGTQKAFKAFETAQHSLTLPKLLYVVLNIANMLLGVYKLSAMGLIPNTSSDWLAFLPEKQYLETSATTL